MSFKKSNAIVAELLAHLDEQLLPPEMLAVPQRHDCGSRVSGASTRLYNASKIQKQREHEAQVRQLEQRRQAAATISDYDSASDRHLRKYWKKRVGGDNSTTTAAAATVGPSSSSSSAVLANRAFTPDPASASSVTLKMHPRTCVVQVRSRPQSASAAVNVAAADCSTSSATAAEQQQQQPTAIDQRVASIEPGCNQQQNAPAPAPCAVPSSPAAAAPGHCSPSVGSCWSSTSTSVTVSSRSSKNSAPASPAQQREEEKSEESNVKQENDETYDDDFDADVIPDETEEQQQQQKSAELAGDANVEQGEEEKSELLLDGVPSTTEQRQQNDEEEEEEPAVRDAVAQVASDDNINKSTAVVTNADGPVQNMTHHYQSGDHDNSKSRERKRRASKNFVLLNSSKPPPSAAIAGLSGDNTCSGGATSQHIPLTAEALSKIQEQLPIASGTADALVVTSGFFFSSEKQREKQQQQLQPVSSLPSSGRLTPLEGISNMPLPSLHHHSKDRQHHSSLDCMKRIRRLATAYSQLSTVKNDLKAMEAVVRRDLEQQQQQLLHENDHHHQHQQHLLVTTKQQQQQQHSARSFAAGGRTGGGAGAELPASGFMTSATADTSLSRVILPPLRNDGDEPVPARIHVSKNRNGNRTGNRTSSAGRPDAAAAAATATVRSLEPIIHAEEVMILCEFLNHAGNSGAAVSALSKSLSLEWMLKAKPDLITEDVYSATRAAAAAGTTGATSHHQEQKPLEESVRPVEKAKASARSYSADFSSSSSSSPSSPSSSSSSSTTPRRTPADISRKNQAGDESVSFQPSPSRQRRQNDEGTTNTRHQMPQASASAAATEEETAAAPSQDPDFEHHVSPIAASEIRRGASRHNSVVSVSTAPRRTLFDLAQSVRDGSLFETRNGNSSSSGKQQGSLRVNSPRSAVAMIRHGVSLDVLIMSGANSSDAFLRCSPFQKRVAAHAESAKRAAADDLVQKCVREYCKILASGMTRAEVVRVVQMVAASLGIVAKKRGQVPKSLYNKPPVPLPRAQPSAAAGSNANNASSTRASSANFNFNNTTTSVLTLLVSAPALRPISAPDGASTPSILAHSHHASAFGAVDAGAGALVAESYYSPSFLKRQRILDAAFRTEARGILKQYDRLILQEEKEKALAARIEAQQQERLAILKEQGQRAKERAAHAQRFKAAVEAARQSQVVADIVEGIEASRVVMRVQEARRLALRERKALEDAERTCERRAKRNVATVSTAVRAAAKEGSRKSTDEKRAVAAAEFTEHSIRRRHQEQVTGHHLRAAQRATLDELKRSLAAAATDSRAAETIAQIHGM